MVRPHYVKLILLKNVTMVEALYEQYFSKAVEPELRERGEAVALASRLASEEAVDLAATYLTDACYYYHHKSPY